MNESCPPPLPYGPPPSSFLTRAAPVVKLGVVGILTLVLLIPLAKIGRAHV